MYIDVVVVVILYGFRSRRRRPRRSLAHFQPEIPLTTSFEPSIYNFIRLNRLKVDTGTKTKRYK